MENEPLGEVSGTGFRRTSIENLKKASRVKNSSMFDRERQHGYDPASAPVSVERPLAAGRPFTSQYQSSPFSEKSTESTKDYPSPFKGHRRSESQSKIPLFTGSSPQSPHRTRSNAPSPVKTSTGSPTKSSLTHGRWTMDSAQDSDNESEINDDARSSTPRPLRRIAKSVTFDAAPPQVNEYEMVTPDPSSVASGSREGSYESFDDYDEGDSFERGSSVDREDSFDASLEDITKTPVVLPGDWTYAHETPYDDEHSNNGSPSHGLNQSVSVPKRQIMNRSESINSDGSESRPLPPLPPIPGLSSPTGKSRRESAGSLSAAAERVGSTQRLLPSPPRPAAVSKSEILSMRDDTMTLEDRLRLMGLQDSPSNGRKANKDRDDFQIHEDSDHDEPDKLGDYQFPRISRESILRGVKSRKSDDDQDSVISALEQDYSNLDPDVPIPSREVSSNFEYDTRDIQVKHEDEEEEEEVDVYSIPEMYSPSRSPSRMDNHEREGSVIHHDISEARNEQEMDEASQYSSESLKNSVIKAPPQPTVEEEGPPTPKVDRSDIFSLPSQKAKYAGDLPALPSLGGDDDFQSSFTSYLHTSPKAKQTEFSSVAASVDQRSDVVKPLALQSVNVADDEDRPDTPDSVIHHSISDVESERDTASPEIPEQYATIKAPGGSLKTRPSFTPGDMSTMAAARRQVSGELSFDPRNSIDEEAEPSSSDEEEEPRATKLARRHSMKMKLEIPTADGEDDFLSLDKEFDRVIEAQKVCHNFSCFVYHTLTQVFLLNRKDISCDKTPRLLLPAVESSAMRKNRDRPLANAVLARLEAAPVNPAMSATRLG